MSATDEMGNTSSTTVLAIHVSPPVPLPPSDPVAPTIRFSEVAWAGTFASPQDEWIEIHNTTEETLSLDGLTIRTTDGGLSISLSGTIAPKEYYVISRSNDAFIDPMSLWVPDMVASFGDGLDDGGEGLELVSTGSGAILDGIPYCENWCEKGKVIGLTMLLDYFDDPLFNWDYWYDGFQFTNIRDRNGDFIRGLPGEGTENVIPT